MKDFEVVLPRRAIPQPQPAINPGGDCGPCCLAGIFGLSVSDVYARLNKDEQRGFSYMGMYYALYQAMSEGLATHIVADVPTWDRPASTMLFGNPGWCSNLAWFRYVTMAIQAGYYGLAAVAHDRTGPLSPTVGDHWVLICGARTRTVPAKMEGAWTSTLPKILKP